MQNVGETWHHNFNKGTVELTDHMIRPAAICWYMHMGNATTKKKKGWTRISI